MGQRVLEDIQIHVEINSSLQRYKVMKFIFVIMVWLVTSCAFSAVGNSIEDNEPLHRWLKSHPNYKLADITDCNCLEMIEKTHVEMRGKFNPYKLEGDFDGDGRNDLAVIAIEKTNAKDFLILVFASRLSNGDSPIVYGNIFGNTLVGLGLFKSDAIKGKTVLLFGAFGSEAEPIHIPLQVPN